jgi:hypothetical protein
MGPSRRWHFCERIKQIKSLFKASRLIRDCARTRSSIRRALRSSHLRSEPQSPSIFPRENRRELYVHFFSPLHAHAERIIRVQRWIATTVNVHQQSIIFDEYEELFAAHAPHLYQESLLRKIAAQLDRDRFGIIEASMSFDELPKLCLVCRLSST